VGGKPSLASRLTNMSWEKTLEGVPP